MQGKLLLVLFVVLSLLILVLLSKRREHMEDPVMRISKLEEGQGQITSRLDTLEKDFEETRNDLKKGEADANAALGNLQMTL